MESEALSRIFYLRKTLIAMMIDRGYLITNTIQNQTFEQFKDDPDAKKRETLTMYLQKKDDPNEFIFIFFPDEAKVGVKTIKNYCEKMKDQGVQRALIVVQQALTSFARQALMEMAPKYKLEQFTETELLVNITEHQLVPKHNKLTPDERKQLLQRYKLTPAQLPRMQVSDPVARYFGLERGEVVKIVRASETAGRYVTYRLVV